MGKLANPGHYAGIFLRIICHSFTRFSSQQRDRVTTQKKRGENATGKNRCNSRKAQGKTVSSQQCAQDRVVVENNALAIPAPPPPVAGNNTGDAVNDANSNGPGQEAERNEGGAG